MNWPYTSLEYFLSQHSVPLQVRGGKKRHTKLSMHPVHILIIHIGEPKTAFA